jgi:hypothetical protein
MIISRSLLIMRNVSHKSCTENQYIYFIFNIFLPKIVRVWDNVEKYDGARQATDDHIIGRMPFACWLTKATATHSNVVTRTLLNLTLYFTACLLYKNIELYQIICVLIYARYVLNEIKHFNESDCRHAKHYVCRCWKLLSWKKNNTKPIKKLVLSNFLLPPSPLKRSTPCIIFKYLIHHVQ